MELSGAVHKLTPFQLFTIEARQREHVFFQSLSPIEIQKRIAYQWSVMNQSERRSYYNRCGVAIDKEIQMKLKRLPPEPKNANLIHHQITTASSPDLTQNSDDYSEGLSVSHRAAPSSFAGNSRRDDSNDKDFAATVRRSGKRTRGGRKSHTTVSAAAETTTRSPRRSRGGKRRT
ncbi:hypothetical protein TRFO_09385 [Tritrichomonas foetus]|uniref:Uncharacterized protein n=1 Tax=Tritrichomonas foetus TaxID=1144522 RepID=A0A1J4JJF1_9EUKA|nr:hypothetical protein TRFO_09385 [Tritrichomonas foetus]|eukprot:OHS97659.1 hypothetical protein TRFO_09385 [Tritrichomonas foetus]